MSVKSKPITPLLLSKQEHDDKNDNHEPLPPFYIINCLDQHVFIPTRSRKVAQEWVDGEYGKGKYTVRVTKL